MGASRSSGVTLLSMDKQLYSERNPMLVHSKNDADQKRRNGPTFDRPGFQTRLITASNQDAMCQSYFKVWVDLRWGLDRWQVVTASAILMPNEVTVEFHPAYRRASALIRANTPIGKRLHQRLEKFFLLALNRRAIIHRT